jgi:hypothetical protein
MRFLAAVQHLFSKTTASKQRATIELRFDSQKQVTKSSGL